ncbi:hypothetical protein BT63DRAFT_205479 [Microthyrium microscopicum]|uniref:Uncharacterized protein n=1 Tax=Microthyrium microscopicum TaxID=703497 RepID=A0A6A6UFC5_9PEZI|nr:hypothetical protein BT63DRAFT_205479 [Microthyrium microscopicum]
MASLTTFRGRRCTKVRRGVGSGLNNSTLKETLSPSIKPAGATSAVATSSKSVYAPTTNYPGISGQQIATVIIPAPVPTPNAPTPNPQPAPAPAPTAAAPDPIPQPAPPVALPPSIQSSAAVGGIGPAQVTSPPSQNTPAVVAPVPVAPNSPNNPQPNNPQPNSPQPNNPTQPRPTGANSGSGSGTGGGSGSGIGSTPHDPAQPGHDPAQSGHDPNQPPGPSGSPNVVSPVLQSVGPGGPMPIVSLGQGPVNTEGVPLPVPVLFTSSGIIATTWMTPSVTLRPGATGVGTDMGRNKPTGNPKAGTGGGGGMGGGAGASVEEAAAGSKAKSTAIIAGSVSAIVAISLICALIFFCLRRRRQQPRDLVSGSFVVDRRSSPRDNVRAFFSGRNSRRDEADSVRSNTPALERGLERTPYMQEVDTSSRRRSSSEPASRAFNAPPPKAVSRNAPDGLPTIPKVNLGDPHRRSVSSISGMAYPVLSDLNNPFIDPDPSAPLRIVNRDASLQGTPLSTPLSAKPPLLPMGAFGMAAAAGVAGGMVSSNLKHSSPLSPTRSNHRRTPSTSQNPFADPVPISDPFADPEASSSTTPKILQRASTDTTSQYSNSPAISQTRTMPGIPQITKTAASSISSHKYNGSADSGFASASPESLHSPRFNGLGINIFNRNNHRRTESRAPLMPTSSPRVPFPQNPDRLSVGRPPRVPSGGSTRGHERLSSTSSSSSLSLSFPSSWGSPGPTRPPSMAGQPSPTERSGGGSPRNASRVSDPFDLDLPELLEYANSDANYSVTTIPHAEGSTPPAAPPRRQS